MQRKKQSFLKKLRVRRETLRELDPKSLQGIRGGTGNPRSDVSNNCCDPDQTNLRQPGDTLIGEADFTG